MSLPRYSPIINIDEIEKFEELDNKKIIRSFKEKIPKVIIKSSLRNVSHCKICRSEIARDADFCNNCIAELMNYDEETDF